MSKSKNQKGARRGEKAAMKIGKKEQVAKKQRGAQSKMVKAAGSMDPSNSLIYII